jgi:hypothetical protein
LRNVISHPLPARWNVKEKRNNQNLSKEGDEKEDQDKDDNKK